MGIFGGGLLNAECEIRNEEWEKIGSWGKGQERYKIYDTGLLSASAPLLFYPGHRPMGLNNTPVTVAMLIHFGAIPPHLCFAGIRDIIEGQNSCLSADLDLGALTSIKKAEG